MSSLEDVSEGLESADNAMAMAAVGGAVAAGVATKVMPKGMKRELRRRKGWVDRKSKRCKEEWPCLVSLISLVNGVVSLALYFLDVFTDVQLCITFYVFGHMGWFSLMVGFIALPYVVSAVGIVYYACIEADGDGVSKGMKIALVVLLSPALPALCDVFMPFFRLVQKCVPDFDDLTNFMVQYEATRTLSETVLETIPQMALQIYIFIFCNNNHECEGIEQEAGTALVQSLIIGGICILYRFVLVYYEMKAEGLGLCGYVKSLVQLGAGLPLRAITGNTIKSLDLSDHNLEEAQLRSLFAALKGNTSVTHLNLSGNEITDAGAIKLAEILPSSNLTSLFLDLNQITGAGAIKLAEMLPSSKLTKIWLKNKQMAEITDIGAINLANLHRPHKKEEADYNLVDLLKKKRSDIVVNKDGESINIRVDTW